MSSMSQNIQSLFKVSFVNQDKVYEVYCRQIFQSDLYGFIEVEEFVFGERTQLLVDPAEEKLKTEFSGVKRSYLPMHSIIRIDEVDHEGVAKIKPVKPGTVSQIPVNYTPPKQDD